MAITKIQTVTVGSGGIAAIDFTSIPGTYTDLMVVFSGRPATGGMNDWLFTFNGATTNRTYRQLYGGGSGSGASDSGTTMRIGQTVDSTYTANTFGSSTLYIPNYASTTTNKSASADNVYENNGTTAYQTLVANLWASTAAITSISIFSGGGVNLVQHSSATLYGITKGSSGGVTVS